LAELVQLRLDLVAPEGLVLVILTNKLPRALDLLCEPHAFELVAFLLLVRIRRPRA
jgi:hypothetical protein